jgi:uncharacterized protein (UPF0332 family)
MKTNQYVQDFFDASEEKLASALDDATAQRWNSCASSLYYSAFDASRGILLSQNIITNDHSSVYKGILDLIIKKKILSAQWENLLKDLLVLRQKADYPSKGIQ